jgi:hypothetical protein
MWATAIFLALFVLSSQNRLTRHADMEELAKSITAPSERIQADN